jgi:hypothetical protein
MKRFEIFIAFISGVLIVLVLAVAFGVSGNNVQAEVANYSPAAAEIDPLVLNQQYTAYFNDLRNSPIVCVSVVRNDISANSTVTCVNSPFPSEARIENIRGLGNFHEEYVIMIYPSRSQLVVVLPKNVDNPAVGPSSDG